MIYTRTKVHREHNCVIPEDVSKRHCILLNQNHLFRREGVPDSDKVTVVTCNPVDSSAQLQEPYQ